VKEIFQAQSSEISRSLKSLANAGLITKRARRLSDVGNNEVSYYVPTVLGKTLIKSPYKGLLPAKPMGTGQVTNAGAGYPEIGGSNTRVEIGAGDRLNSSTGDVNVVSRRYNPIPCQPPHGGISYGFS